MVKKISGNTPAPSPTSSSGVKESTNIQSTQVNSVSNAASISQKTRAAGVRSKTRPLTADERKQLMRMVDEEAEKLFGSSQMAESDKEVAREAVKLTVEGGVLEEEDS